MARFDSGHPPLQSQSHRKEVPMFRTNLEFAVLVPTILVWVHNLSQFAA